jgi:deaminated glutathione amidase
MAKARHLIGEAAAQGAQLVALPEAFVYRGRSDAEHLFSSTIPGPVTDELGQIAQEHGIWLLAGSIFEKVPGQEKVFNTSTVFNSEGECVASYRKIHLFEIHNEKGKELSEADYQAYGSELVCLDTPWLKLGLSICFDLRFPELYRQLAKKGAQLLAVPSAFLLKTGRDHWEVLLRARAIETQCYVIAPNCLGASATGVEAYGRSMIIDPWGQVIAQASDRESVIVADLDLAYLEQVRRRVPTLSNCRLPGF